MSKKKKSPEILKLEKAAVLYQAYKSLVNHNEVAAYDGPFEDWLKLKDGLVAKYAPIVQLLAQAGMLSFVFEMSRQPIFREHWIKFDANDSYKDGSIVICGNDEPIESSNLGHMKGSFAEIFNMLCKGLPDYNVKENERLNRRVWELQSKLDKMNEQGAVE